jgi:hypothetical protein
MSKPRGSAADGALALIVMILVATSPAVPRHRLVNDSTRRFRGNAHLPADSAWMSCHAAMRDVRTATVACEWARFSAAAAGRLGRRHRDDGLSDAGPDPAECSAAWADRSSAEPTTRPSITRHGFAVSCRF